MDVIAKSDVFFFITTIAVVCVSVVLIVVLIYAIRILRDVFYVIRLAKQESSLVKDDIDAFRARLTERGAKLGKFVEMVLAFVLIGQKLKKKSKK
jgi:uncharacterized protein YoxC